MPRPQRQRLLSRFHHILVPTLKSTQPWPQPHGPPLPLELEDGGFIRAPRDRGDPGSTSPWLLSKALTPKSGQLAEIGPVSEISSASVCSVDDEAPSLSSAKLLEGFAKDRPASLGGRPPFIPKPAGHEETLANSKLRDLLALDEKGDTPHHGEVETER